MKLCSGLVSFLNELETENETMLGVGFIFNELEMKMNYAWNDTHWGDTHWFLPNVMSRGWYFE
jgi:hypothetical protein